MITTVGGWRVGLGVGQTHLVRVLGGATHVLLDFDGPTCDVFAGLPAADVAARLRDLLAARLTGGRPLDDVLATDDPLHVVRRVADLAPALLGDLVAELRAAELRAIATAEPTPGAAELLTACRVTGRPVAIVSNNDGGAVRAYLELHGLAGYVRHVQGRHPTDPGLMKPHPYPLRRALAALGARPEAAVLVGDSRADLDGARAAGVAVVAYVNKARKLRTLADADAVTTSMRAAADALTDPWVST